MINPSQNYVCDGQAVSGLEPIGDGYFTIQLADGQLSVRHFSEFMPAPDSASPFPDASGYTPAMFTEGEE